ncbi:MAG: DNA-binding protein [Microcystis sp. M015S2]|nr:MULTISPECIES: DNA-binding protein [unclassified Microcystis]MCA2656537.1 DNA-binding protein [Microcystis sp. M061S2]MCA2708278.1 DNA-binding protein [Microcystis sp. M025S2]MCA2742610.1 DNA-binding protein [Microcystis sp. M015S2]MCA2761099.1 DNA-binding protein [Microcystis sp. M145S2]
MSRPNILQVRLSDEELEKLKRYAQQKQISAAEVVRDWIKNQQ